MVETTIKIDKFLLIGFMFSLFIVSCQNEKIDVSEIPAKGFRSERPARIWEESLVTGNGTMGVMVAGRPYSESIVFNHALLYLPLYAPLKPVSQGIHLEEIRQMMLKGQYDEASRFIVDLSHREGYGRKRATDPFIPAFRLHINSDSCEIKNYARTVDFTTGEVEVKYENEKGLFSRKIFISRPDNVVVIRMCSNAGAPINASLNLSQITTYDQGRLVKFEMDSTFFISKIESEARGKELVFRAWYKHPWEGSFKGYEGVIKIIKSDGEMSVRSDRLIIKGATDVLLFARVEPSMNMDESHIPRILTDFETLPSDYNTILNPHRKIHEDLFNRVTLDLEASKQDRSKSSEELLALGGDNPALIERIFNAARYHVICATGINPPNLQGIWGETMTAPWSGDYTTNGNLPVAVSHYLQANTPELMLPLFNRLESFMDEFKMNAQELFGCRGIHVPSRFSTHGLNNHFDATWPMTFWIAGAAWYSMFYYDYYLYTQDRDFLRNRALPFMEQSALFYEDFLTEGIDGKYIFNPSYSPENNPINSKSQACINATMDVMAAKALLRALIEASRVLDINSNKIPVWKTMLNKMPPYELNEKGEIREWMWGALQDNHNHRHASHLFGLYDLHDTEIMQNEALIEGCKRVIDRRMEVRRRDNGGIMAFGMVQLAFNAATLGEVESAYDILTWLGSSYWNNNMVSTHDPGRIFNVDICGGYPSLIMKMLVYSEPGLISLLPCMPEQWKKGSIRGVALRGGIIIEKLKWDGRKTELKLRAKNDQTVRIKLRGQEIKEINLKSGQPVELENN
ncbi:MAG: glycoside hydrolase family 95 protein [Tannerella sp.]|jgi:hypothetical protein|nr:glycoside hydrolase family 95 protein [Tannerella sp.]